MDNMSFGIGVLVGTMLPFVVMILLPVLKAPPRPELPRREGFGG